jgi:monoamine oxidase
MSRTPLLRAILRLARESHEADRLGIDAEELREREYTRRELLRRGGAAGAGLALAGTFASAASGRPSRRARRDAPRIAIVGGGIAGLAAALKLQDRNVASTVFETTNHVGGRMHSDRSGYWDNGQTSEFCGELIDTGHRTIRSLAQRFNLPLVDLLAAQPAGTEDTFWFRGGPYSVQDATADFQALKPALTADADAAGYPTTYNSSTPAGQALDRMTVYEWIESRVAGGHASRLGRLLDAAYNAEYGAETTDQAALNLVYLLGFQPTRKGFAVFGESDERFHIAGGNERLPEAIAETLGDVRVGNRMTSIATNGDGSVTLGFDDGPKQTFDHVILALPFSVLRTLEYSRAGFDDLKKLAIRRLGAGRNAKLQLQFTNRYWNGKGSTGGLYTDIEIQNAWDVTRGQDGATGIMVDYSGGDLAGGFRPSRPYSNADQDPRVAAYARDFLDDLETVFPGISRKWNGKATLSTPFLDPNLLCSYSYWRVGQYTSFSGYEGVPQGNIHFAGEHCSQNFQGFMEGGASEGVRAAKEILRAL